MGRPPRLILASGSPRRDQLFRQFGIPYRIRPARVDEVQHLAEPAVDFARRAAREKALAVAASGTTLPVLAADTVVDVDGTVLGKPSSPGEAASMLRRLSGITHHVHSGMALAVEGRCDALVDTTAVRFHALSRATIDWYVATGEPMDKAGAYALQGRGGLLVARIEGSPHTVVGLPIHRLSELFSRVGLDFWDLVLTAT